MRILIASSTYAPAMNGQAVFTTNLAEGLVKREHEVLVVLDSHHERSSTRHINGVQVEELRSISLSAFHQGVYFSPFPRSSIKHLIDHFRPDIIHIQDHYPVCWAAVHEARKRGIKIVGSNHFIPENLAPYFIGASKMKPLLNWLLWQWMLAVYRHVDVISAQSQAAVKLIKDQGVKLPIIPISCGIDLLLFHPEPEIDRRLYRMRYGIDPMKKIFLFLGRIDGEKRIDLLLKAVRQLSRDDIQLVIAGNGKVEASLRRQADDLGIDHQVKFTGFIPTEDVPAILNCVDVFVMPSDAELLSISTLEAMACGKPVLLADALALPELVRNGENGYLFTPGGMDDLVRVINIMADYPELWPKMGAISRQLALAHNIEETIQQFESIYVQLATQGSVSEVKLGVRSLAKDFRR